MSPEDDRLVRQLRETLGKRGVCGRAVRTFQKIIYAHYTLNRRVMPWRRTRDPYRILVSEVMLQQTQVERVLDKYELFVTTFPDFRALAAAPLSEILSVWHGLGYNRRAIALKRAAEKVTTDFRGALPSSRQDLLTLPGIGEYTASAIATFAFDRPSIFIETNIRRVFIHFFFSGQASVTDAEIMPLVESALDRKNPREWYYALMDYGAMLGGKRENPNMRSAHYRRQTRFAGSDRQVRGAILKTLLGTSGLSKADIVRELKLPAERVEKGLDSLTRDGFLRKSGKRFTVA